MEETKLCGNCKKIFKFSEVKLKLSRNMSSRIKKSMAQFRNMSSRIKKNMAQFFLNRWKLLGIRKI